MTENEAIGNRLRLAQAEELIQCWKDGTPSPHDERASSGSAWSS
jgi:hypothetical protein